ncbi:hypothetical protein H0264_28330 [Nocardia huaxiensis]|uniref:Uncharacterized protein n=1 Tax=Nocardia huaxiensis TaxID=2755382 RepID=A0A7D6V8V2_9NOCA|nr:hypothetical protein [Nocardia huaxiensis]QLY29173.1 hypothetical protein H0264_28330 [Nocardia huaxiensis]
MFHESAMPPSRWNRLCQWWNRLLEQPEIKGARFVFQGAAVMLLFFIPLDFVGALDEPARLPAQQPDVRLPPVTSLLPSAFTTPTRLQPPPR